MPKKMLIDAAHHEETRVAIVDGSRVEEFDFESASRRQLRGNIYLARVTRVEPSLQAAFVEFGGNRHGFLAFNEIHPDYFQIPHEDQQELKRAEQELLESLEASDPPAPAEDDADEAAESDGDGDEDDAVSDASEDGSDDDADDGDDNDDVAAEIDRRRRQLLRKYKIQEVIKRRQILLVQAVKEERGNKGAALTTYLSLAGRYCVLMPNTARGGGISRKITSAADRKRLKKITSDMEIPDGMGLIVRTAGAKRTKAEIKRDADYLRDLWEAIREDTMKSIAPCLIYEESNLVKRAIRDLYDKDIDQVLVEGDTAYREAKDFMRRLMPSHAKKVQPYKAAAPLFLAHGAEQQLDQIYNPTVTLKSGGYLVINQTEALVAIDVNSGRSTKERNIEATALKTNLEAAEEACRQFRLRDLAGLIVIDFIDMDEAKNNRAVEKRMRDALKRDRARVQTGRISQFGLMELSRQRRRANLLEGSHVTCRHCEGRGVVRSVESAALMVLRRIEEDAATHRTKKVAVTASPDVALYLLNDKRDTLNDTEARFELTVIVTADPELKPSECRLDRLEAHAPGEGPSIEFAETPEPDPADEVVDADDPETTSDEASGDGERKRRRRRRRRRGGGDEEVAAAADADAEVSDADADAAPETSDDDADADKPKRRRRRGRRGGRGRRGDAPSADAPAGMEIVDPEATADADGDTAAAPTDAVAEPVTAEAEPSTDTADAEAAPAVAEDQEPAPKRPRRRRRKAAEPAEADTATEPSAASEPEPEVAATPEPEPEPAPEPEPEPEDIAEPALAGASTAPVEAELDPEAEARRQRWQDRLKSWLGN